MNGEGKEQNTGEGKKAFDVWNFAKMWEDSYFKVYKPWIESTCKMIEKVTDIPKDATPEKYKEFYDEWTKIYQSAFDKFYPTIKPESNKEALEKLLKSAEKSNELYKSWIAELEKNSQMTKELLQENADPAKYKECSDMWMKSYEKIFEEMSSLPIIESTAEIFENYTGTPNIYLMNFVQMTKLWKNTYIKIYGPWIESMQKLSAKMAEISKEEGEPKPEIYKEFYTIWMETYKETFGKDIQSMKPSKDIFEGFMQSTNIYLDMYRSWIVALEKMSKKAEELSKKTADPEIYKEFYSLWIKMYEKAFESFFEDIPVVGPMKELMEPAKNIAKMYTDMFIKMSKMWVKETTK